MDMCGSCGEEGKLAYRDSPASNPAVYRRRSERELSECCVVVDVRESLPSLQKVTWLTADMLRISQRKLGLIDKGML